MSALPPDDFYVGYYPKLPLRLARRTHRIVFAAFLTAGLLALAFAAAQQRFAPSRFEFGEVREYHGVLQIVPFPTLKTGASTYLLVAPGKHGAEDVLGSVAAGPIHLKGTLISRAEAEMLEVLPGSVAADGAGGATSDLPPRDLGLRVLTGEIVDTKCFLGVMNPGQGKVHRECAVACLRGGIPPALFTMDLNAKGSVLLLADEGGRRLPMAAYLPLAGRPVRIRGRVLEKDGLWTIRTHPTDITKEP
jgi:hypothetical protein